MRNHTCTFLYLILISCTAAASDVALPESSAAEKLAALLSNPQSERSAEQQAALAQLWKQLDVEPEQRLRALTGTMSAPFLARRIADLELRVRELPPDLSKGNLGFNRFSAGASPKHEKRAQAHMDVLRSTEKLRCWWELELIKSTDSDERYLNAIARIGNSDSIPLLAEYSQWKPKWLANKIDEQQLRIVKCLCAFRNRESAIESAGVWLRAAAVNSHLRDAIKKELIESFDNRNVLERLSSEHPDAQDQFWKELTPALKQRIELHTGYIAKLRSFEQLLDNPPSQSQRSAYTAQYRIIADLEDSMLQELAIDKQLNSPLRALLQMEQQARIQTPIVPGSPNDRRYLMDLQASWDRWPWWAKQVFLCDNEDLAFYREGLLHCGNPEAAKVLPALLLNPDLKSDSEKP